MYTTVVINFLPRMTFTNGVQCKTGMVVHHNNAGSNVGQSQRVTLYIPLTPPFSSVYSNVCSITLLKNLKKFKKKKKSK